MSRPNVRSKILEAAFAVMADRPFHEIGVKDIAEAAGVSVRTLYNYFEGGRNQILVTAAISRIEAVASACPPALSGGAVGAALAALEAQAKEVIRFAGYHRGIHRVLSDSDEFRTELVGAVTSISNRLVRTAVERMEESGELAEWVLPESLSRHITLHLFAIWESWARGELPDAVLPAEYQFGAGALLLAASQGDAHRFLTIACRELQGQIREASPAGGWRGRD